MPTRLLGPESTNEYVNNFIKSLIDHFHCRAHALSTNRGEARDCRIPVVHEKHRERFVGGLDGQRACLLVFGQVVNQRAGFKVKESLFLWSSLLEMQSQIPAAHTPEGN